MLKAKMKKKFKKAVAVLPIKKAKVKKVFTHFTPRVYSQQPSHKILRQKLGLLPFRSVIRLGSTTNPPFENYVEINSVESIKISSDKKLMKEKFIEAGVSTATWTHGKTIKEIIANLKKLEVNYPIIAKSRPGSRGIGNYLIEDEKGLENWAIGKQIDRYIFERYYTYGLEYRLHVTKDGCFYTCRKALKKDADADKKFQRHVDNTVWYLENNLEGFMKPDNWNDIVADCVKALTTIGADVLSFDVKVQSKISPKTGKPRKYQNFILIESNSASSMKPKNPGEVSICAEKYLEVLPKLLIEKYEAKKNG